MDNSEKEKLNIVLYYFLLYAYIVDCHSTAEILRADQLLFA